MDRVAYCRVSDKKGIDSFENQKQYFEDFGVEKLYTDFDISGMSLKHRQGFIEMLNDAGLNITKVDDAEWGYKLVVTTSNREPKFKHIYVKSTSRFSRNSSEAVDIVRCLKAKGVYVHFLDLHKSTEDESIDMVLSILFTINNEESINISKRTRWGNAVTAGNGVFRAFSLYGYERVEDEIKPVECEAEIINKIYELRAFENIGSRKIAKTLTDLGYKNREGKDFAATSVMNILQNETYTGKIIRNKYNCDTLYGNNKKEIRPREEWIITEAPELRIISQELFDKVQEEISKSTNKATQKGVFGGSNPYKGKIKCKKCGSNYTTNIVSKTGRIFYNCNKKKKHGIKECDSRNIDLTDIESVIEKYIGDGYKKTVEKILNEFVTPQINIIVEKLKDGYNSDNDNIIKDNEVELQELEEQLDKVMDLYILGTISKEKIDIKSRNIKNRIDELNKINYELSLGNELIDKKIYYLEFFIDFLKNIIDTIPNNVSREEFIEKHFFNIIINDDGKAIVWTKFNKAVEMILLLTEIDVMEDFDKEAKRILNI